MNLEIPDSKINAMLAALVDKRLAAMQAKIAAMEATVAKYRNPVGRPQFAGTEKTCSIRGETKPVAEFYPKQGRCKACFVGVTTEMHRKKRLAMIRAADKRARALLENAV